MNTIQSFNTKFFLSISLLFAFTWTHAQVVSCFSGTGVSGNINSASVCAVSKFTAPSGVAIDAAGTIYIADYSNHKIRKITTAGVTSTVAGSGSAGFTDGNAATARFNRPSAIALDATGNLYVADYNNHSIRMITPAGVVSTIAGFSGESGNADGPAATASFNGPSGVALDATGNIYITDTNNQNIRKISGGVVFTFSGTGTQGGYDGDATGAYASYYYPTGIATDAAGNIYVADRLNHKIRKISPVGVVQTIAGSGIQGTADGQDKLASFDNPTGITVDATGNVYVTDAFSNRIRKINTSGYVSTFAGSVRGRADGVGIAATFYTPWAAGIDASGNIYIADRDNNAIRKISPTGIVQTVAGSGSQGNTDGTAVGAGFYSPKGLAIDPAGNMYVCDNGNHSIRKITPAGMVSLLAGSGKPGAVDATGAAASFNNPTGLAIDANGNVYVADRDNHKIRKITPSGVVTTFAGSGTLGSSNGVGTAASFYNPQSVALDASGTLFVAENGLIRKITTDATVSVVAGIGAQGVAVGSDGTLYLTVGNEIMKIPPGGSLTNVAGSTLYGGGDYFATQATFTLPTSLIVDAAGNLYIADTGSNKVRKITPGRMVSTVAGSGISGDAEGPVATAQFRYPSGIVMDVTGVLYISDSDNNKIKKINAAVTTPLQNATVINVLQPNIYPNPVYDKLYLQGQPSGVCTIYRISGEAVAELNMEVGMIDVSALTSGLYLLKMDSEEGYVIRKFMKE